MGDFSALLDSVTDEISPVPYTNLAAEFKKISATLKDPDPDRWEKRDEALKKMAGMTMYEDTDHVAFAAELKKLKMTLIDTVEDLRSAIVRTTAGACVVMCEQMGSTFDPVFEFLLPSFIKQLAVKAIPTRESAHQCVTKIVVMTRSPKILAKLYTYTEDKNAVIRTRVVSYVAAACEEWDDESLRKNLKPLLKYLNASMSDKDSKARTNARGAVATLGTIFPAEIAGLYKSLSDPKVKKELDKILPESVLGAVPAAAEKPSRSSAGRPPRRAASPSGRGPSSPKREMARPAPRRDRPATNSTGGLPPTPARGMSPGLSPSRGSTGMRTESSTPASRRSYQPPAPPRLYSDAGAGSQLAKRVDSEPMGIIRRSSEPEGKPASRRSAPRISATSRLSMSRDRPDLLRKSTDSEAYALKLAGLDPDSARGGAANSGQTATVPTRPAAAQSDCQANDLLARLHALRDQVQNMKAPG